MDEHYYKPPQWFLDHSDRYDKYDRNGPKVFAGEYAAQTVDVVSTENRNSWGAAMAEAAFMTGLERNADVVRMASYAPLFAHVDGWQWTPDLIWYDNLRSYGTPNYYVQKLFSTNVGSRILPVTIGGSAQERAERALCQRRARREDRRGDSEGRQLQQRRASPSRVSLGGAAAKGSVRSTVLASDDLKAENSLDQPKKIAPVESTLTASGSEISLTLPAYSLSVVRIPVR